MRLKNGGRTQVSQVGTLLEAYYRRVFARHGPGFKGADWPKEDDALLRYGLHRRAMEGRRVSSVLDVGCGTGYFFEFLRKNRIAGERAPRYLGVDCAPEMIAAARKKYPDAEFRVGALQDGLGGVAARDFAVANGVFTVKAAASKKAMWAFIRRGLDVMWKKSKIGMSFNLMTTLVDYRYDRLMYIDPAEVVSNLAPRFGRRFAVYHDSRLFDAVYVWLKEPAGLWRPSR